jgi:multiple sugar transport system permease protein
MRLVRSEHAAGWAFLLPAVVLIVGFGVVPIVWSLLLSFQSSDFVSPPKWVGLANYRALAHDPNFRASVLRTLEYTAIFVPIVVFGGLGVAVLLNAKVRFISLYRTAFFVPVACSTVATAIIFNWLGLARAIRVLPGSEPGALLRRRDDRVGLDRLQRDHLSRCAAGHPD